MAEFRPLMDYPGHTLFLPDIVRAENCHLYDAHGNTYVDMESGVWCTSIGHGNPQVLQALTAQAAAVAHTGFSYSSGVVAQTAADFLELLGFSGGGKCVFLCSGSEAVEFGLRVIRKVSGRPLVLTMADTYSGAYGEAYTKHGDHWHLLDWTPCTDCQEQSCDDNCPTWMSIPFHRIAAFLFEPGSSAGQVRFPPKKLVRAIAERLHANSGLLMANEVTTGFGRTGEWFGYQHYDLAPDVVALGKGIGNGYPVSLCALSPRVVERLGETPVPYAQSHQNDPLGAAVAGAVLGYMQEHDLIGRAQSLSKALLGGLEELRSGLDSIEDVRGRGLMAAIALRGGPEFAEQVQRGLFERGFIVGRRPGLGLLRLDPALTMDEADLTSFLEALRDVLSA